MISHHISAQHATGSHHTQQAAAAQQQPALFNAAAAAAATIPPGYGYAAAGGLPYYPAGPAGIIPPGLQYPPTAAVFPAVSTVSNLSLKLLLKLQFPQIC